jgi:hypothetical protein
MLEELQALAAYLASLRSHASPVIRGRAIPPGQVTPPYPASQSFDPGQHYFSVIINEMFLRENRQWFDIFDPMTLVLTEFLYDGKQVQVPFVVGPTMLEGKVKKIPNGMSITDTKVAGVIPYVGGNFALTIVLAKVRRASYAKRLLSFVETVSSVFPHGAALGSQLALAKTVLAGTDALFGLKDDVLPLAGHRWEYDPGVTPWLQPGFFALVNTDIAQLPIDSLRVKAGRLHLAADPTDAGFRRDDFLLYSVNWLERRSDVTELPFYRLFKSALRQAGGADAGAWSRAKAGLATLYQEMLTSPDLTFLQTQELIESFKAKLIKVHEHAKSFSVMGAGDRNAASAANATIDAPLQTLPNAAERSGALQQAQDLLQL